MYRITYAVPFFFFSIRPRPPSSTLFPYTTLFRSFPGCLIPSRVIGVMRMIDKGEADDKIIAVAEQDVTVSHIEDVDHLPNYLREELKHFFENYKTLENKIVVVDEFQSKQKAIEIIEQSIAL